MRRLLSYRFVPLHVSRGHMFLLFYNCMIIWWYICWNSSLVLIYWGAMLSLLERFVNGWNFWLLSYDCTTVHQKENRWAWLTCSVGWEFLDLALKQFPSVYNATLHTGSFPQHLKTFVCQVCTSAAETVSAIARFWSGWGLLLPGAALAGFIFVLVLVLFVLIWLFFAVSSFCSSQVLPRPGLFGKIYETIQKS